MNGVTFREIPKMRVTSMAVTTGDDSMHQLSIAACCAEFCLTSDFNDYL